MTYELRTPSVDVASRLLAEVPYAERLTGVNMHCLQGPTVVDLYSVHAAARFLHADDTDVLRDPVSGASFGYIDPAALAWWLEHRFGDEELARAIGATAAESESYIAAVGPLHELLAQRLEQCLAVAPAAG